ncbi:MAG: hypothetical protein IC227_04820 [Enterococcus lacertideformus]|uniref:Uncharacterized protein n=1 Tax=Enterococcus lacertideformus TaxID=2771493 RepID=A0A931FBN7_9ENTE|nr:hypothetical protein [Enterococcus lacertideformus]
MIKKMGILGVVCAGILVVCNIGTSKVLADNDDLKEEMVADTATEQWNGASKDEIVADKSL